MLHSGVFRMVAAQIAFTAMVVFVKIARQELSTFEVAFWRSILVLPLLWALLGGSGWRINRKVIMLLRSVLGFGALCSFFGAAKGLTIADLSLISKIQPVLVAVLAPLLIGGSEKPEPWLWAVMGVALAGCMLLLAPSLQVGSLYGLMAVSAAIFSAGAHTCLRLLKQENPIAVVVWFQVGTAIMGAVACVLSLGTIPIPPNHLWGALLAVGVFAGLGQLLMTAAYKVERAPVVATASYVGPVFAVIADVIAFADWPTFISLLGGTVVISAGLVLLWKSSPRSGEYSEP